MIYLVLSIISSTLIFVIFKYFQKFEVNNLAAIVINYFVASTFGIILSDSEKIAEIIFAPWLINALIIGGCFIILFLLIALTTQKIGMSVASISNKMSVVIPIVAAVFIYNDSMPVMKAVAILIAVVSVYLSSIKEGSVQIDRKYLLLPIVLFVGNGFIDTFIKYTEYTVLPSDETSLFLTALFVCAGLFGLIIAVIKRINLFEKKNIIAGIILGLPNYGSIYFLIKTLELPGLESSVIFPINNVAIVICSAVMGVVLFKEKLSIKNKSGIALAVLAIAIIAKYSG